MMPVHPDHKLPSGVGRQAHRLQKKISDFIELFFLQFDLTGTFFSNMVKPLNTPAP